MIRPRLTNKALTNFAILGVIFLNFWIYWIFAYNFFIGELLVIETVLLYFASHTKTSLKLSISIIVILILLGGILLINHLDKNILSVSTIESIRIKQRAQYFKEELGHLYTNRVGTFTSITYGSLLVRSTTTYFLLWI